MSFAGIAIQACQLWLESSSELFAMKAVNSDQDPNTESYVAYYLQGKEGKNSLFIIPVDYPEELILTIGYVGFYCNKKE